MTVEIVVLSDLFESIEDHSKHLPVEVPQVPPSGWSSFDAAPKEVDPFDTSFAEQCAPGKVELRLLEKEILESPIVQAGGYRLISFIYSN